jgi:hypothetical protein
MRKELDELLCSKYPKIFRDRNGDMRETAMCWGFDHDDGWFNIIDKLCANIQHHINVSRRYRFDALVYNRALTRAAKGDYSTYNLLSKWKQEQIDEALKEPEPQLRKVPHACSQVLATQVKEKFGTLRFYYYGGDDIVAAFVNMAESMSSVMCEECGAPGHSRDNEWIKTLCDEHDRQREERNAILREERNATLKRYGIIKDVNT